MKLIYSLVYFGFIINLCSSLRWMKSGLGSNDVNRYMMGTSDIYLKIDVGPRDSIVLVRNARCTNNIIRLACIVSGYHENSELIFHFCRTDPNGNDECTAVKDGGTLETRSPKNEFRIFLNASIPNLKGLIASMTILRSNEDFSSSYYCKAKDAKGGFSIRTNVVEYRDTFYWERNYVTNAPNEKREQPNLIVTKESLPYKFECPHTVNPKAPSWINSELSAPVKWLFCPVKKDANAYIDIMNPEKCIAQKNDPPPKPGLEIKLAHQTDFKTHIDKSGSLIIYSMPASIESGISFTLMCFKESDSGSDPIVSYFRSIENEKNSYKEGVEFEAGSPEYTGPLVMIEPKDKMTLNFYSKTVQRNMENRIKSYIFALYKSKKTSQYLWKFNGQALTKDNNKDFDDYMVTFTNDVLPGMTGLYELTVSDGNEKITASYQVYIRSSPTLADSSCMEPVYYVKEGDSVSINCTYKGTPETIIMQINSEQIKLNSGFNGRPAQLDILYPYLSNLDLSISPKQYSTPEDEINVSYQVQNLKQGRGQTKFEDHIITFISDNKYGMNLRSSSIYVVPKLLPQIKISPDRFNCTTNCKSSEKHKFQCVINQEHYKNKEMEIDYFWTVNNHRLDQPNVYSEYFTVDPNTKELTMNEIKSNNTANDAFVKKNLKDSDIICHFNLLSLNFRYDSIKDPTVTKVLRAKITLDFEPLNSAFVYWLVAVILALIVIIVLIVLLVKYLKTNKGETYQLDKLERKHGYDPEKEVQEEMFKPYEREETDEPEIHENNRRPSITDVSIGSAEDGELDNYDIDTSKFNEDGSITGQYGANPRSRAEMV